MEFTDNQIVYIPFVYKMNIGFHSGTNYILYYKIVMSLSPNRFGLYFWFLMYYVIICNKYKDLEYIRILISKFDESSSG